MAKDCWHLTARRFIGSTVPTGASFSCPPSEQARQSPQPLRLEALQSKARDREVIPVPPSTLEPL